MTLAGAALGAASLLCRAQDARFDDRPSLATGSEIAALSLADLDGDGDPDIVAADDAAGRLIWIENNSDIDPAFSIEHTVGIGLVSPRATAIGDIDGDGDPDIAAAVSTQTGRVVWFENTGGLPPVFVEREVGPRPNLESTGIVRSVTLADLEGDGDLDIVCGFRLPTTAASGHVTVYLNNGAPLPAFARFQLPSLTASLFEVSGVATGDANGDGAADVIAVSREPADAGDADSLVLWLNTGQPNPGFMPAVAANGLGDPAAVAVARLNADQLIDIAVAEEQSDRVTVFGNTQATPGAFVPLQSILATGVRDVDPGRLAGGIRDDLLAATSDGPLLIENLGGAGLSLAPILLVSPDGPVTSTAIGRIDADGDDDFAAAGPAGSRWFERVQHIENTTTGAQYAAIADAVGDVNPGETLRVDPEHLVPDVFVPPTSSAFRLESTGPVSIGPRAIVVTGADLTIAAAPGEPAVVRGVAEPAPGTTLRIESTVPVELRSGQMLDDAAFSASLSPLSVDLMPELAVTEIDGDLAATALGLSNAPRDARFFRPAEDGPAAVATVSEIAGGGGSLEPGSLIVYTQSSMLPGGWLATEVDAAAEGTHRSLAPGDLNRDGHEDLVTVFVPQGGSAGELRAHLSSGTIPPSFKTITIAPSEAEGGHVVFDLDRDGRADVVTPTGYYRQVAPMSFAFVPFPLVGSDRGLGVAIASLNGDFEPDVVVHTTILTGANQRATGYRLVGLAADGLGSFLPTVIDSLDRSIDPTCIGDCYPETNTAATNLNTVTVADLDHDGDDDVVLSEDQGLTIYETQAGGYTPAGSFGDLRWSESVALDAGGDGVLDLVVAATPQSAILAIDAPLLGSAEVWELARPVERVAAIDAGDLGDDDTVDLVFAASAFDRVAVVRRDAPSSVKLVGAGATLGGAGFTEIVRGTVDLQGGSIASGGMLAVRRGGTLRGEGQVFGSVLSGGTLSPRPTIAIAGNYAQFDVDDADRAGTLDVLLPISPVDPLFISGQAALAGSLRVEAEPSVVLGLPGRRLVRAQSFDPLASTFDTTLVPRLPVDLLGQPEPGVGVVTYPAPQGESLVVLVPEAFTEPPLLTAPFPSLARPADAKIADIVGGPNGGPDGVPDIVIAYPQLPNGKQGGIALLRGEMTERGCGFQPVGVYTGPAADRPVAVEVSDFDGDGIPEIAFGNRGDSLTTGLVRFLDANSQAAIPLTESQIAPVPLAGDRRITDLAVISLSTGARGPTLPSTLLTLSGGGLTGTVTASTYEVATNSWEVCDIDVCDDPDSFDPIDPDGAAALLGDGFTSTSKDDDKVVVAKNDGGMPDTFPIETFAAGANPTEIRTEDLNNDGFPDIAAINETSGTVSIFVNIEDAGAVGGRTFAAGVEWSLRSDPADPDPAPGSIALADLDDDGDLDIAVVSTDATSTRAVRTLTNLFVETGALSFTLPENLPEQPADTPVLVRELDAGVSGGVTLNDDLVVLTDPSAGSRPAAARMGGQPGHVVFCSELDRCPADVNGDGLVTSADFNAWILAFNQGVPEADQNGDGLVTPADFNAWIFNFNNGC